MDRGFAKAEEWAVPVENEPEEEQTTTFQQKRLVDEDHFFYKIKEEEEEDVKPLKRKNSLRR